MGLRTYRSKRNLNKTTEPKGGSSKTGVRHFVVQKHRASHLHYDFRLEFGGALKSWAVPKGPPTTADEKRLAVHVEDHPLNYRNFSGTIPEGNYGAGTVEIWDHGTYTVQGASDTRSLEAAMRASYKKGELEVVLHGKKMKGVYILVRMTTDKIKNGWLLIKKEADQVSDPASAVHSTPLHHVQPMLAKAVEQPFDGQDWLFEIKWDGYRALAEVYNSQVHLYSRSGQSFNSVFADIVADLQKIPNDVVLDGEVVVLDDQGRSHFQLLQDYRHDQRGNLVYEVFDLLYADGQDLRSQPLWQRKAKLKQLLPKLDHVRYSDDVEEKGKAFFASAKKAGLEGMIAKRADSTYLSGTRSADWLKVKAILEQEAVICGYTEPRGSRQDLGALILGIYKEGQLTYIGHTGGGSNAAMLTELKNKLTKLEQTTSPFSNPPHPNAKVHWVKPKLVCQVKFQEWTSDGVMRQPIFLGLRQDKTAKQVVPEEFTHADKIFWPQDKITKGDLLKYYQKVAPVLLPHLQDRPMSLHRFPNGIAGEDFFQKDLPHPPDFISTFPVGGDAEDKTVHYLLCNDQRALEYMVQLGSIEMNPWNSRVESLDQPDYLILDLDPEAQTPFSTIVRVAQTVHRVLESIGAASYCKTSGSTGLHVYVPLAAKYNYEPVRLFAKLIAQLVHDQLPDDTSLERGAHTRGQRVHLDYPQNRRGATTVAAYSVRPQPGATVSTPLNWSEVRAGLDPKKFTIKTVPARIKKFGDLWKPVLGKGIDLKKCLEILAKE